MNDGDWVKLHRRLLSSAVFQDEGLLKVFIWCLLKAKWRPMPARGGPNGLGELQPGQFRYGRDRAAEELEMRPSTVRNRMTKLAEIGCVDIKPDSGSSVVTVCNWLVYQFAADDGGQPEGQAKDSKRTQEKNAKNSKNNTSSRPKLRFDGGDRELAEHLWSLVQAMQPERKPPNLDRWANSIRLMREQDNRTHEAIRDLFTKANRDPFWQNNILSPDKLRQYFDDLELKLKSTTNHDKRSATHRTESPAVVRRETCRESFANLPRFSTTSPTAAS